MKYKEEIGRKLQRITTRTKHICKKLNIGNEVNLRILLGRKPCRKSNTYKNTIFDETQTPDVTNDIIYKNSEIFLKGTITNNPQNDYSQYFVDTGNRPQNYIMDTAMNERYREYPKLNELLRIKDEFTLNRAHPPLYMKADLRRFDLKNLNNQFDVILIEPPLKEYLSLHPGLNERIDLWDWNEIADLDINSIASMRSFVFLWCGSYQGLEGARMCFRNWGFRRCEDICWIKTNKSQKFVLPQKEESSIFLHTKEHLLMGIRGTIRRSCDYEFIHANVDLDVMVTEEPLPGDLSKPEEIFYIIEHFCMGRRRLHLFGNENTIRPGWVTVGPNVLSSNFDPVSYSKSMAGDNAYMGTTSEIESLRPKSPSQRSILPASTN
ncbi:hypothetical protein HZS_7775 [Henneguya salminicola]|nr:hypothetical protein HZS_7775 [Henneguya salminicola]